jgi:rhodanese-related sulfurtransferase
MKSILAPVAATIIGGFLANDLAASTSAAADELKTAQAVGQVDAEVATVTSPQLAAMLRRKDFYFVNVHVPYEGEIKDTDAFIVYDKIAESLDKLPRDKSAKIVLYCRSGRMSEIATRELARLGYSQVSHLAGGMIDWKQSGYEIIEK